MKFYADACLYGWQIGNSICRKYSYYSTGMEIQKGKNAKKVDKPGKEW